MQLERRSLKKEIRASTGFESPSFSRGLESLPSGLFVFAKAVFKDRDPSSFSVGQAGQNRRQEALEDSKPTFEQSTLPIGMCHQVSLRT